MCKMKKQITKQKLQNPLRACKDHKTQKCNFPPVFAQQITQNRNTIPWRELARMKPKLINITK
jgi:hypothetical protein